MIARDLVKKQNIFLPRFRFSITLLFLLLISNLYDHPIFTHNSLCPSIHEFCVLCCLWILSKFLMTPTLSSSETFLQVANKFFGGVSSFRNCLTSSRPIPRLQPVINTDLGETFIFVDFLQLFCCISKIEKVYSYYLPRDFGNFVALYKNKI